MCVGDQVEKPLNPAFSEIRLGESSLVGLQSRTQLPRTLPGEVQGGLSCFYSFWPPARTPLGSRMGGAAGCGRDGRQSPSSVVPHSHGWLEPQPTLRRFRVSAGGSKGPHTSVTVLERGKKKKKNHLQSLLFKKKKKVINSGISSE